MKKLQLDGVVFDVDGVLFDAERLTHRTWVLSAGKWARRELFEQEL